MPKEIDIVNAQKIFTAIESTDLSALKIELYWPALHYAQIRASWKLMATKDPVEADNSRSRARNSFIDLCNILSRTMVKSGELAAWHAELGSDRKSIGDFACYLHCFFGFQSR
jgi:hypothetical protein